MLPNIWSGSIYRNRTATVHPCKGKEFFVMSDEFDVTLLHLLCNLITAAKGILLNNNSSDHAVCKSSTELTVKKLVKLGLCKSSHDQKKSMLAVMIVSNNR